MPMLTGKKDGATYINTSAIRDEPGYEDVTPDLIGKWLEHGHLTRVTRREWAAAMGRELPADLTVGPDEPAQWPGGSGPENVYRWDDVVRCETGRRRTRRTRGGRPRGSTTRTEPPCASTPSTSTTRGAPW